MVTIQFRIFFIECSAFFVLHEGLVISSNGEKIVSSVAELNTDNMLRVSSVASWVSSWTGWIVPEADKTVIVTSGEKSSIWGAVDSIDVGSVDTFREDSPHVPGDLD